MESPKPQSSDEAQSDLLAHAASSYAGQGQPPAGHLEESERVWAAVRSLKGERRALRAQLQDREYVRAGGRQLPAPGGRPPAHLRFCEAAAVHRLCGLGVLTHSSDCTSAFT